MAVTQDDYWTQVSTSMIDKVIDTTTKENNRYQILEELGRGSYGCLFLGQSLLDNAYVAIKVLCKTGLDHQQLELQQLEIDIQQTLKHTHLLTLHGTVQDKDYIYMVMELCDQGDLFDFVVRSKNNRQEDLVVHTFSQILEAVDYMHSRSVYHRDIKLENILLKTSDLDESLVECKVADFGLATRERFNMEFGCGSTSYLAPEHFDDEENNDAMDLTIINNGGNNHYDCEEQLLAYDAAASDIWSLGILLLALLFGRNPWEEATTMDVAYREFKRDPTVLKHQLFPTLSTGCYRLLKSVLSPNPANRPSITEMKHQFQALDRLLVDEHCEEDTAATSIQDNDDDYYCWPVDIPTTTTTTSTTCVSTAAAVAAGKKSDKVSFDSAIFSGTYRAGSGESWSDMVEEEQDEHYDMMSASTLSSCSSSSSSSAAAAGESSLASSTSASSMEQEDDDTDMFIHTQEKGSWWL